MIELVWMFPIATFLVLSAWIWENHPRTDPTADQQAHYTGIERRR